MYLSRIQLTNFKNYENIDLEFSANINCFVGNNGVGKTNILDAIYYLAFCKSYFNPIDSQNIRYDQDFFAIHGSFQFPDQEDKTLVSCVLKKGQSKQLKFNKKTVATISEHIGRIPLVIVSPNDQVLIMGGSEVRRKFIDGVISQIDSDYLHSLLNYQKVVEQRNRLLKQFYENKYVEEDALAIWDDQLVRYGTPLIRRRMAFLEEFLPFFNRYFDLIVDHSNETPSLNYLNLMGEDSVLAAEAIASSFAIQLKEARKKDALLQYTTVGPHKDDFELLIDQHPLKKFGSQGQQKTILLALKLAQFEYIQQHVGRKPILLLDDIFDKLDLYRIRKLIQIVGSQRFGQVFITDTQQGRVEEMFKEMPSMDHRIFQISQSQTFSIVE